MIPVTAIEAQINCLGMCYSKLTGIALSHRGVCNPREAAWYAFIKAGYTVTDLELVILWLKLRIRDGVRHPECLKFQNLLGDIYRFEEEFGLAKAQKRNAKPAVGPREQAMGRLRPVIGPLIAPSSSAKPIGDYIAAMRKAVEDGKEKKP